MAVRGDWTGQTPTKKVWFSDVLASPKVRTSPLPMVRCKTPPVKAAVAGQKLEFNPRSAAALQAR
jgi:hypothetical protein